MKEAPAADPIPARAFDAVGGGAGFPGLYMLHRLRGLMPYVDGVGAYRGRYP